MKKFSFTFLISFLFQLNIFSQTGWYWQNTLPQVNHLYDVSFIRQTEGCAVGDGGVIFRTTDVETSLNLANFNTSSDLRDIFLSNFGTGNAAMIYNDSIVEGYSAITNTFSALAYNGTLVTLSGYFC